MFDEGRLQVARFNPMPGDSSYEYDRMAVVTCAPVRRLQQKTQVFALDIKASSRSRLTHSLEVQCMARQCVLALAKKNIFFRTHLSEILSIIETAALVHDVGNPPFGHLGEDVIKGFFASRLETIRQAALGGAEPTEQWKSVLEPDLLSFDGNAQSIRLLHTIQKLNLSAQVLASLIKTPCRASDSSSGKFGYFYSESILTDFIRDSLELLPGERFGTVTILEYADNLSYALADIEDAIDKGILSEPELMDGLRKICADRDDDDALDFIEGAYSRSKSEGLSFIAGFRRLFVQDAIDAFTDKFADVLNRSGDDEQFDDDDDAVEVDFTGNAPKTSVEQKYSGGIDSLCTDASNKAIAAMIVFARKKVFRRPEIEELEITGNAAVFGLLGIYQKLMMLSADDFMAVIKGKELKDPILRRLAHRFTHRAVEAYLESVSGYAVPYFESDEEKELYYRIRLLVDYLTGMTDTYLLAEFSLLKGDR